MKPRPNTQDVAQRAGVSRATVSYVLNGRTDVVIPEGTRERVRQAARDLSYRSNRLADGVLRGRTGLIGVVVPNLGSGFYTRILQGVHEACEQHGYGVLLAHSGSTPTAEQQRIEMLMEYRVDALICVTFPRRGSDEVAWANEARGSRFPCVLLDHLPADEHLDGVASDDVAGARAAVTHLIGQEHRRIGHLCGDLRVSTGVDRHLGYTLALEQAGIPFDPRLVVGGHYLLDEGRKGMLSLLDGESPPTAVFAANDDIAEGALEALACRGLRVPDDMALIGYGNLEAGRGFGLTTVDQNPQEMGRQAVRCVLERLKNPEIPLQRIAVATHLVLRRSTGQCTAAGLTPVSATQDQNRPSCITS